MERATIDRRTVRSVRRPRQTSPRLGAGRGRRGSSTTTSAREHLLLGLLRLENGIAREALERFGVDFAQVHRAVGFIVGGGEVSPTEQVLSPRTKRVIELAEDEAQAAGSRQVGDEHLLLGLVREGEGMASGILLSLGVALERIREELLERRGPTASLDD